MNLAEMRTYLNLPSSTTDAQVAQAYADYLDTSADLEPLTLEEAKANLRVVDTGEDILIAGLITAARVYVEGTTGLVLTPRIVTETVPHLGRWVELFSWPVTAISEIRYPLKGVLTPLPGTSWATSLLRRPVRIIPTVIGWGLGCFSPVDLRWRLPTLPVEIDVQAGYATPADVPQPVKQAMQLLVAHWFENRTAAEVGLRAAAIDIPFGVDILLKDARLRRV